MKSSKNHSQGSKAADKEVTGKKQAHSQSDDGANVGMEPGAKKLAENRKKMGPELKSSQS